METKHTKGEWFPVEFAGIWMLMDSPMYESIDVLNADYVGEEKAKANAKLAAAAPDLLDALIEIAELKHEKTKDAQGNWNAAYHYEFMQKIAVNAIKKATE